jgi:hypothetical protein
MTLIGGHFVRGRGIAAHTTDSEQQYLSEITGRKIITGTANFLSNKPVKLKQENDDFIYTYSNGRKKYFWPAELNGRTVYITRWQNCPLHIFELFADHMITNDTVMPQHQFSIKIDKSYLTKSNLMERLYWYFIWFKRENWWYSRTAYWSIFRLVSIKRITGQF